MDSTFRTPNIATTPEAASPISFENIWIGFEEGPILRGLTFSTKPGETLVLLGETGTGKTLALKIAAGLLRPDKGTVKALDQNITDKTEDELLKFRRQIGFVFQEGALFDSLTVGENVAYRLEEDGIDQETITPQVQEVLRFVELEHTIDMLPSELSGGMRRRVSIARALITRPPIVLYDSPTAGLDPITSQTIITLILRLRDVYGVTALMATHRLQDGFALANFHFDPETRTVRRGPSAAKSQPRLTRFLVLREGRIYFEGTPEELLESKDSYLQRFLI
ncbi:MAG TPA: ATP-binding cassette domain-containing protein [Candidatus Acidoferrum sp.]|nr:ATP-binding cassette domain-containing protein [Candidatus Acidoferrum sp.]